MKFIERTLLNKNIQLLCLATMLFIYCYHVFRCTVNFPFEDDYDAILGFLYFYKEKTSSLATLLFAQHNEHRIVWTRLIVLIQYTLSGLVNFKYLAYIGNAGLLAAVFIFYKSVKKTLEWKYILPVFILILQFNYYEISFWAMGSLQNFWVLFWCFLIFYLAEKSLSHFRVIYFIILFSAIAAFTNANGFLALPILIVYYLLNKKYKLSIICVAVLSILYYIYFNGYTHITHSGLEKNDSLINRIPMIIKFFYYLIRQFIYSHGVLYPSIYTGLLTTAFIITVKNKLIKQSPALIMSGMFILGSMCIIAFVRSKLGIDFAAASRYTIYPDFLLAISYVIIIKHLHFNYRFYFYTLMLAAGILISLKNYKEVKNEIAARQHSLIENRYQLSNTPLFYPHQDVAAFRLFLCNKDDIFIFPVKK